MLRKALADYGGPYVDRTPVKNPTNDLSATKGNRVFEDVAQLTRTGYRMICNFLCNTTTNPAAADTRIDSMWGNGDSAKPSIVRDGIGLYTLTFPASYTDDLSEAESTIFLFGHASAQTNNNTLDESKIKSFASNVVVVAVYSAGALSDLAGTGRVTVWLR